MATFGVIQGSFIYQNSWPHLNHSVHFIRLLLSFVFTFVDLQIVVDIVNFNNRDESKHHEFTALDSMEAK